MKRILTGDRPTGPLHLGHYVGSLENRVKFQDDYDSYILIADVQALTDNFDNPEKVRLNTLQVLLDNISVGLDPQKVTFHLQSAIPQIAELTIFYANLVSIARLERNPTVKDEIAQKADKFKGSLTLGFLMYPVSQAADITIVKGEIVPVGEDQVPHIEQAREIVRKFNSIYGNVFPEPEVLLSENRRLVGTDGNAKMSKSIGNCIYLSDTVESVNEKVKNMYTDPNRIRATDPGRVEGNPVFIYHDIFNPNKPEVEGLKSRYLKGAVGDVEVKQKLAIAINTFLEPIRERRSKFEDPQKLMEILDAGTKKAQKIAQETMKEVKDAMGIYLVK
ncbi:tryptophan--tRNA ligase [candidate division WWE3 bacterium CG_4_9_14_0_2_um_filter_35_11]|uniref:Tryptophan--tRNA ligase n=1 Tax=candidate division WWE3 bacterium CG_4_9_14_0_2_um_filter_35_11 TaxID=1975077 RepID=A0A2M8ELW7_UNCKA|nr:MAG: tryptophan--tRNA ligase [candidate division WWE3 bacterium CG10_big_fil_rev_8_21_14_0_10_35_32]PJC23734.1 MAG: tryptophan--tRNA ligase [candidate division WWE3 bacterium CG_4_9_14_0_2_um_filter_35_11]